MKVNKPPEATGDVQEQIDDIRRYLNLIYKQLLLNSDSAAEMLRTMYESITTDGNGTLSDLFGKTITAKKVIVESDLDGSKTIIDGGAIQAETITGDKISANTITGNKIAANTITGDNIVAASINGDRITANTLAVSKLQLTEELGVDYLIFEAPIISEEPMAVRDMFTAQSVSTTTKVESPEYSRVDAYGNPSYIYGTIDSLITALQDLNTRVTNLGG